MSDDERAHVQLLQRALLALASLSAALLVALLVIAGRSGGGNASTGADAAPAHRADGPGVMDSFPDADVGRTLLPDLAGRDFQGAPLATNAWGMREQPYALARPDDTVRVVLLGDSYVFGWGVAAEERVGSRLQELLAAQGGEGTPAIEILHVAVPSWSILAECAYLRRQLDVLRPDLVVQVVVDNDLDDVAAVRGFGEMSTFGSRFRDRADALVHLSHPPLALGSARQSLLSSGLDWLSQSRYAEAAAALEDLARATEALGGRYLVLVHFGARLTLAAELLVDGLDPAAVAWLPADFAAEPAHRLSASDGHWSPAGHQQIAHLLHGLIVERTLLPSLEPAATPASDDALRRFAEVGARQATRRVPHENLLAAWELASSVSFPDPPQDAAGQVHAGIDRRGRVGRWAALLLANEGATRLRVDGRTLDRTVLTGSTLVVTIDGEPVHDQEIAGPDEPLQIDVALPASVRERPYLTIGFQTDDHVYAEEDPRHAVAWILQTVALLP